MTLDARVTAPVVRPVLVGWFDFVGDPAFGWTGPGLLAPTGTGDPILDNNVFSSAEGAVRVSDFSESTSGARAVQVTFSAHDNDADIVRQIVRDRRVWQLRRAKIWLFFLQADEASVHSDFVQLFSGVIAQASLSRQTGDVAEITLDLDADLRRAGSAPARLQDHSRFNAADAFSSFIARLANGPLASALPPPTSGGIGNDRGSTNAGRTSRVF